MSEPNTPLRGVRGLDRRVTRLLYEIIWRDAPAAVRRRIVLSMAAVCVGVGAQVLTPLLFKQIIDGLSRPEAAIPVAIFALFVVVSGVGRIVDQAMWGLFEPASARIVQTAEHGWFRHVQTLSLRFHLTKRTGGLDQTIQKASRGAEMVLSNLVYAIVPMLLELILIAGVVLEVLDWRFAVILGVTVALFLAILVAGADRMQLELRRGNELNVKARGIATDAVLNFETVQLFGGHNEVAARHRELNEAALGRWERFFRWRAWSGLAQALVVTGGLAAMLWIGMQDAAAGTMTVGGLVLVNSYLVQLVRPLQMFNRAYRGVRQGVTYMSHLVEVLEERPEVAESVDARPLPPGGGRVEFRDVSFAYDPRRPILKDVSFALEPGRTLAIVGATGSGKSTVARLLFRFYDATDGAVIFDGVDVRSLKLPALRDAIAVVPQDTVLFNDSLRANVAFGRRDAEQAEIDDAARRAHLTEFVASLPDGWDSVVGERGLKLSGGEKQRVAIARAILKRPRLFVFDEATSALDTETERRVMGAIRDAAQGATTLMIAHRLSTVVHADEILVLDQGRVVERGSHADLVARNGAYAAMWRRQQEAEERNAAE